MSRSRPGSARPTATKRSSTERGGGDGLLMDCKAAYLVVFDSVHDKITSRKELIEVLQQAGRNPTRRLLKEYWANDTDDLSFDEFVDICRKEKPTSEDELMSAFKKIDINGDGYIDNYELKKVLTTRGEPMSVDEVQDIIDEVDENKDGRLDYKEFCKMMLDTQDQCKKLALQHMERKAKKNPTSRTSSKTMKHPLRKNSPRPYKSKFVDKYSKDKKEAQHEKDEKKYKEKKNNSSDEDKENKRKQMEKKASKKTEVLKRDESEDDEDSDDDSSSEDDTIIFGTSRASTAHSISPSTKKDKFGSQSSLRSGVSENGSRSSPKVKERSKSPIVGKDLKLPKPKKLKDWHLTHSKGCFYFDDDNMIISHHYEMKVTKDTSIWITIEPITIKPGNDLNSAREEKRSPMDTMLFILRHDNSLVTFTEHRDVKGKYAVRCDLERGTYKLIPFTTGCRFKPRLSEPSSETKLLKKMDDKYTMTKAFKEALNDIFEMCDLDGNGYLSRNEFNWFNIRTSGEEVNDKEWEVVEGTLDLHNGEITRQGFIHLNQMEADDNEGDTEELWVTLSSMGFNKALNLDEACPFIVDIYSESCTPKLTVTNLDGGGTQLEEAIVDATMGKGEVVKIRNMRDLFLHTYVNDFRASMVIENRSHHSVKVSLDCRSSDNCTSNTRDLEHTITVPAKSSMIAQHILPTKETKGWTIRSQENVVK